MQFNKWNKSVHAIAKIVSGFINLFMPYNYYRPGSRKQEEDDEGKSPGQASSPVIYPKLVDVHLEDALLLRG